MYIASVSMADRSAAATFIVPRNTVLMALTMGMEELGPVQLILMLDDDVRPKIDWLARIVLLHNMHTCVQNQVPCSLVAQRDARDGYRWRCRQFNGGTHLRNGSFFKSKVELGNLFCFSSRGRRTCHHTTWRDTWVSRLGRWSTGPTSSETSAQRTHSDSRCSSVCSTTPGIRSSSSSTSPNFIVGNTTAAEW